MSSYQEKITRQTKRQKIQFEEIDTVLEPYSDMSGLLELSDQEFFLKKPMISMLNTLMDKADSMQEQMGNVSREMENLRKNQKEMLEIKNTATEMNNAFDGPISRLGMAEKRL